MFSFCFDRRKGYFTCNRPLTQVVKSQDAYKPDSRLVLRVSVGCMEQNRENTEARHTRKEDAK